jgi:hypothetical protein
MKNLFTAIPIALLNGVRYLFTEEFQTLENEVVRPGTFFPDAKSEEIIIIYGIFLWIFQEMMKRTLRSVLFPFLVKPMSAEHQRDMINRIVSSVHAIFLFFTTIGFWIFGPHKVEFFSAAPDQYVHMLEALAVDLMLGYLVYDTLTDTIWVGNIELVAHHVLGFLSLGLTRAYFCVPAHHFMMMVFLAESSTPLLHASWTMKMMGQGDSWEYFITGCLLLLTFFLSRVVLAPYTVMRMWETQDTWETYPYWLWLLMFSIQLFFTVLNLFWFYRLLRVAGVLPKNKQESAEREAEEKAWKERDFKVNGNTDKKKD